MKGIIKLKLTRITKIFPKLFWTSAIACYYFQFPYSSLSKFIIPSITLFLASEIIINRRIKADWDWLRIYSFYIIYIFLSCLFGMLGGNQNENSAIRFLLILIALPLFTIIHDNEFEFETNVFLFLSVGKVLLISYYWIQMFISGSFIEFRAFAEVNKYGDMYINPYTHLPAVQVMGNALIVVAFIVSMCKRNYNRIITGVLLFGIVVCGNAAFILGAGLFLLWCYYERVTKRKDEKRMVYLLVLLIAFIGLFMYSWYMMEIKADYSNAVRKEQFSALVSGNVITGNGLGNRVIYEGKFRSWRGDDQYYEMQTLYILNQIGIIGLLLFYYLTLSNVKKHGNLSFIIFIVYLIFSFFNPHCFDTVEMVTLALLCNSDLYMYGVLGRWNKRDEKQKDSMKKVSLITQGHI